MKNLLTNIGLYSFAIVFVSCLVRHQDGEIRRIEIGGSNGVGPNAFIFILEVRNKDLYKILENCNAEFSFSSPLEELNTSSIQCFMISENEVHIRIVSTLWGNLSSENLAKKQESLNNKKLILTLKSKFGQDWRIKN